MKLDPIVKHYEQCLDKHGTTPQGVDWPNQRDLDTRHEVMTSLFKHDIDNKITVLDFGCGYGSYLHYLKKIMLDQKINYTGIDISEKMITAAKELHPNIEFMKCNIFDQKLTREFDYIILNGVLTEKQSISYSAMEQYAKNLLSTLLAMTKKGLSFNIMSDKVDYCRLDLFHWELEKLTNYITNELRLSYRIIDNYLPYETTLHVFNNR